MNNSINLNSLLACPICHKGLVHYRCGDCGITFEVRDEIPSFISRPLYPSDSAHAEALSVIEFWGNGWAKRLAESDHNYLFKLDRHALEEYCKRSMEKSRDETILILNKYVPRDAPIVWDSAPEIVAVLANRQHNCHCGRAPKNIKYFVSVGEPRNGNERDLRDTAILAWRNDPSARVLYEGNPGQPLLIFERSNSTLPYRHEDQLGWNIVTSALGIGK